MIIARPVQPLTMKPLAVKPHATATAKVAEQFEALFVGQMLKAARAAALTDDPLTGSAGATFNDLADQTRAQLLAAQAPLGVAKILGQTSGDR